MPKRNPGKPKKQVAALPVARDSQGSLRVLMITSRETRRFIVPKGWPIKGLKDHRAAETEALEEAGVIGRAHAKPVGSYLSWKRRDADFQLVKVKVFLLQVHGHLRDWKEKGQRSIAWLTVKDAASLIDEPGLADIVLNLPNRLPKSWRSWASSEPSPDTTLGAHPTIDPQAAPT